MTEASSSKMMIMIYNSTQHQNLEKCNLNLRFHECLKSHCTYFSYLVRIVIHKASYNINFICF